MVQKHKVSGYNQFVSFIGGLAKDGQINVYFTGSKDAWGNSWCPDCNDAEPFVEKSVNTLASADGHFVVVDVGDRPFWKDTKNPFRHDKDTHLSVIPTLINWNEKSRRLEGEQLCKTDLLEMFFEQE